MKRSAILKDMIEGAKKDLKDIQEIKDGRVQSTKSDGESLQTQATEINSYNNEPQQSPQESQITIDSLGSLSFKKDYGLQFPYYSGSMVRGISSPEMVIKMGKAGMMGFLGTGGMDLIKVEEAIQKIQSQLSGKKPYGMNLIHHSGNLDIEEKLVDLYLMYGIKVIEASAFLMITPALVKYHAKGLYKDATGKINSKNKIIAKLSRPEILEAFLTPAPDRILEQLLTENKITVEEAEFSKKVPIADDICVEADSGGHTDGGVSFVILPTLVKLRDNLMAKYNYSNKIRIGAAGGIGTPEAAAAAFILGADFIVTGSINQCSVEAATSDTAKDLLQQMNIQDTDYAPAGDMFELGAKVQVLKKGVFFPARANKLFDLYRLYNSLDEIDEKTKAQIEEKFFKRSFESIYEDCKKYFAAQGTKEIEYAEKNPKFKMAIIFRWYFHYSTTLAIIGDKTLIIDYQIHCGPALGAFNQWVKGSKYENWKNRSVDEIALKLLNETAALLNQRFQEFQQSPSL